MPEYRKALDMRRVLYEVSTICIMHGSGNIISLNLLRKTPNILAFEHPAKHPSIFSTIVQTIPLLIFLEMFWLDFIILSINLNPYGLPLADHVYPLLLCETGSALHDPASGLLSAVPSLSCSKGPVVEQYLAE